MNDATNPEGIRTQTRTSMGEKIAMAIEKRLRQLSVAIKNGSPTAMQLAMLNDIVKSLQAEGVSVSI